MKTQRDRGAASLVAVSVAGLVGMALVGAGCSQPASESPAPLTRTTVVVPARTASSTELPSAGDVTVTDTNAGPGGAAGTSDVVAGRIDAAIIHDTQMTGSRVAAVVDADGVATLNGTVQNAQQKALAEQAAKGTPGVVSLKDKLEIRPTGGAGGTQSAQSSSGRLTSLTVGDAGSADSANSANASSARGSGGAAGGSASQQGRVVVVNNYVPVPSQQSTDGSDTASNGNYSNNYNGGYNDNPSVSGGGYYGNPSVGYGSPYGYASGYYGAPNNPTSVLDSDVVPGYLRNMSNANDYQNYARDSGQY